VSWAVTHLGPAGVLLLMIPESACLPVPSEMTLMAAGFAVGQGLFSFPIAVLAATAGNLVGSLLAYAIGRSGGLERLPGRAAAVVERCRAVFDRYGDRAVFLSRLMPLARTFVSLPAGQARVPLLRFVVMTVAGCALWSVLFVTAGLLTGAAWQEVSAAVGRASLVIGAAVVLWVLLRPRAFRASRSRSRRAG
jgi:membrane protein DedA with SNARE-associated domain